jgi:hypothetical protein
MIQGFREDHLPYPDVKGRTLSEFAFDIAGFISARPRREISQPHADDLFPVRKTEHTRQRIVAFDNVSIPVQAVYLILRGCR